MAWEPAPLAEQCSEKVNPWLSLLMLCSRSSQVNLGITPKSPVLMNVSSRFHSCAPGHRCTWVYQKSLCSVTALPAVTLGQIKAEHSNLDSNISSSQEPQVTHRLKELVPAPRQAGLAEPAPWQGVGGKLLCKKV